MKLPKEGTCDTYCPFIQNMFSNSFSILAWSFPRIVTMNCEEKILLNHSTCHCQGLKGQVWLIFPYFSILISSIEVLTKYIASCSFSDVILVLFSNFNGVDLFYFQGQKGPIWTFVIYLGQYLRNGTCYDQCLCESHIQSHSWPCHSWPCDLWPWITFNGQIKITDLSRGCVS